MPPDLSLLPPDPAAPAAMRPSQAAFPLPEPSPQFALDIPARRGLDEVRERIHADNTGKWDLTLPRHRLMLRGGRLVLPSGYEDEYPERLTLSPWATAQACQRLGIPTAYFRKCPPPLRDAQFNHWAWREQAQQEYDLPLDDEDMEPVPVAEPPVPAKPDGWLLRAKGSEVRGILSQRYVRLDNQQLMDCLVPLLESRYEVKSLALTGESLHLRLIDPSLARDVLPNDRLMVGLHVTNSEVGRRAVSVDALVYRLVCTNGLIRLVRGKSLLRQRHISWEQPRFVDALHRALCEALTAGAGLIEQLAWAVRTPVPNVEGTLTALMQQGSLTQSLQEGVRRALLGTPPSQQETVYGFVNALTFVAQGLCPDDRYDLEVLAGRLLENGLPRPVASESVRLTPGMQP